MSPRHGSSRCVLVREMGRRCNHRTSLEQENARQRVESCDSKQVEKVGQPRSDEVRAQGVRNFHEANSLWKDARETSHVSEDLGSLWGRQTWPLASLGLKARAGRPSHRLFHRRLRAGPHKLYDHSVGHTSARAGQADVIADHFEQPLGQQRAVFVTSQCGELHAKTLAKC